MSNHDKIKTKLFLLQMTCLGTGLLSLNLTVLAYTQARYFSTCTSSEQQVHNHHFHYDWFLPDPCEDYKTGTFQHCRKHADHSRSCTPPELVLLAICGIGVSCAIHVIALIVFSLVDLKNNDRLLLLQIYVFGHIIISALYGLVILCLVGFEISISVGKYTCSKTLQNNIYWNYWNLYNELIENRPKGTQKPPASVILNPIARIPNFSTCFEETDFVYKIGLLIAGTIFAILTTILQVTSTIMFHKNIKLLAPIAPDLVQDQLGSVGTVSQYDNHQQPNNYGDSSIMEVGQSPNYSNSNQEPGFQSQQPEQQSS